MDTNTENTELTNLERTFLYNATIDNNPIYDPALVPQSLITRIASVLFLLGCFVPIVFAFMLFLS